MRIVILFLCIIPFLSCEERRISLTVYNQSSSVIDSIDIYRIYSNDTLNYNQKLLPNINRTFEFNKNNDLKGSIKGVNFISYYIDDIKFDATWGHVSGWLSVEVDTIYVTDEYLERLKKLNKIVD